MKNNIDEQFELIRKLNKPIFKEDRSKKDLFKIKENSFLQYNNKTYFVKEKVNYEERKKAKVVDSWSEFELVCLEENGETYFCEVEEDDGLKIYFSGQMIKLRDLNIKKNDLANIVDDEKSVYLNNTEFYYDDDYSAFLNKSDEKVKFVEFEDDNKNYLTIEEYEDGEIRAYSSSLIKNLEVIAI